jgi:peroxiredoxin
MVDHRKFEKLDVQILAISGMNTFSQKMFAASLKLPYPLLSDYPDLKMIQHYNLLTALGSLRD